MSNPDTSAAAQSSASNLHAATEPTFGDKVNDVVKQMTKGDDDIWTIPDDVTTDDSVKYAAGLEKRRRDTESALGKTRLQLKTEEGVRTELEKRIAAKVELNVTPEEAEELELLRDNDPEAWRVKVNQLEQKATTALHEEFNETRSSASQKAELERRKTVLADFNAEHSDVQINDALIATDIPPRITKKLETGEITFEQFLTEAHDFMTRPVTVTGTTTKEQPNLGSAGGGSAPSDEAEANQEIEDYSKQVF